jgi:hypothetical protein
VVFPVPVGPRTVVVVPFRETVSEHPIEGLDAGGDAILANLCLAGRVSEQRLDPGKHDDPIIRDAKYVSAREHIGAAKFPDLQFPLRPHANPALLKLEDAVHNGVLGVAVADASAGEQENDAALKCGIRLKLIDELAELTR